MWKQELLELPKSPKSPKSKKTSKSSQYPLIAWWMFSPSKSPRYQSPLPPKVNVKKPNNKSRQISKATKYHSLEFELQHLRPGQNYKAEQLQKMMAKGSRVGHGTTGWGAAAPQRGSERHALRKMCGDVCFLRPENEGFPVCSKLYNDSTAQNSCQYDCRGLLAAKRRARQWNYQEIAEKADQIAREIGCEWTND